MCLPGDIYKLIRISTSPLLKRQKFKEAFLKNCLCSFLFPTIHRTEMGRKWRSFFGTVVIIITCVTSRESLFPIWTQRLDFFFFLCTSHVIRIWLASLSLTIAALVFRLTFFECFRTQDKTRPARKEVRLNKLRGNDVSAVDQVTAVEEAISIWGRCELEDLIRLLYRWSGRRCLLHKTFNILYFCWRHTRIVYIQYKHLPFPTSPCHPEASPLSLSFQRQSKLTIAASFSHANIQLGSNEHLQQKTVTFSSFVRIWKEKGYIVVFLYLSIDKSTEVEKRADLTQPMNWRKKCSIESQPMIVEQCFIIENFICHLFENDAGGGAVCYSGLGGPSASLVVVGRPTFHLSDCLQFSLPWLTEQKTPLQSNHDDDDDVSLRDQTEEERRREMT